MRKSPARSGTYLASRVHRITGGVLESWRSARRRIRRAPSVAFAVVIVLALGIGANGAILGLVDRVLFRPPDRLGDPDRLRRLWVQRVDESGDERISSDFAYPDYRDFSRAPTLERIAAYAIRQVTLGSGESARKATAQWVTATYWDVLDPTPWLGRFFNEIEDRRGGPPVAVLSYGMWQRAFGGQREAIGASVDFGNGPYTIIGVAPEGFTGPELTSVDLWVPLHQVAYALQGAYWAESRTWWWLRVVGQLSPQTTKERAATEATAIYGAAQEERTRSGDRSRSSAVLLSSLAAVDSPVATRESNIARWLGALAVLLMLTACLNAANLLIAQLADRQHEVAVRRALGATRLLLAADYLLGGIALSTCGALAALGLIAAGGGGLQRLLVPEIAWRSPLSGSAVLVTIASAGLAGVLAGALPAALSAGSKATALRVGVRSVGGLGYAWRSIMVAGQSTLATVLVFSAAMFLRSLAQARSVDLGVNADQVAVVRPVFLSGATTEQEREGFAERVSARLNQVASIESVAAADAVPFVGGVTSDIRAESGAEIAGSTSTGPWLSRVEPSYFNTVELEIVDGRAIDGTDVVGSQPVVVVSQALAIRLFGGTDPLGRCVYIGPSAADCTRVVGIAGNVRQRRIDEPPQYTAYLSLRQNVLSEIQGGLQILARLERGREGIGVDAIRRAVLSLDQRIRYVDIAILRDIVEPQFRAWRVGAILLSAFGLLALLVGSIGLYSMLAFDLSRERRSLGLRAALGATRPRLAATVLRRAMGLVVAGGIAGVVILGFLAPRWSSALFDTSLSDPFVWGSVGVVGLLAVAFASAVPAWRAGQTDPNTALRAE